MYLFSACLEQNSDNQRLRFAIMQKMRFVKRRKNTATCVIIREDDWGVKMMHSLMPPVK